MKDKIAYLMKSEGLTTTRLAEILEIKPSAVSHLVSGRNNPSYDLLQKILRRFPRVNPDWLLLDSEDPYRSEVDLDDSPLGGGGAAVGGDDVGSIAFGLSGGAATSVGGASLDDDDGSMFNLLQPTSRSSKSPIFVVVFYDDGSCERFAMRGK